MSKHHMKLSDVEAQTNYLIPRVASTFAKAYPNVETIIVELRPSGEGFEPFGNDRECLYVYTKDSMVSIINCRNPRCYGGGLNLDYLIRWAVVEAKQHEYETVMSCQGYEGSPKGRRKDGPCDTRFRIKVSVTYKQDEPSGKEG
jgi:hypothetical protein